MVRRALFPRRVGLLSFGSAVLPCSLPADGIEVRSWNAIGGDLDLFTQANLGDVAFANKSPRATFTVVDHSNQSDRRHRTHQLAGADAGTQYNPADRCINGAIGQSHRSFFETCLGGITPRTGFGDVFFAGSGFQQRQCGTHLCQHCFGHMCIPLCLLNLYPSHGDTFVQGLSAIELLLRFP